MNSLTADSAQARALDEAVNAPRFIEDDPENWGPVTTRIEAPFAPRLRAALDKMEAICPPRGAINDEKI